MPVRECFCKSNFGYVVFNYAGSNVLLIFFIILIMFNIIKTVFLSSCVDFFMTHLPYTLV